MISTIVYNIITTDGRSCWYLYVGGKRLPIKSKDADELVAKGEAKRVNFADVYKYPHLDRRAKR